MTIRTFWQLVLKLIGLWFALSAISLFLQYASALMSARSSGYAEFDWTNAIGATLVLGMFFLSIRFLVFKNDWILKLLKLDAGFEDKQLQFQIKQEPALYVAFIVLGGLMFADNFPALCTAAFSFFQRSSMFREDAGSQNLIFYGIKCLIAIVLMGSAKYFSTLVTKHSRNTEIGEGVDED